MLEFTTKLNNLIWSVPMMFLILGAGIFFTVATRAVQFRKIKDMFRIMIDGKKKRNRCFLGPGVYDFCCRTGRNRKHCRCGDCHYLWRPGRDFLDVDRGSDRRSNVFH